MARSPGKTQPEARTTDLERVLGRALTAGTYASMALVAIGVALLVATGRSPLDAGAAPFEPRAIPGELAAGRSEGFLWLGLVLAIATPIGRVAGALVGYAIRGERPFAVVAAVILLVIGLAIVLGLGSA
jgi:uncharacterized membrane protein